MNEYLAVVGTLAGVLVGGVVNYLATRTAKKHEWRLTLARDQLIRREQLYADFLGEARRLAAEAIFRELEVPKDLLHLDRMTAQMTLLSPQSIVDSSRNLRRHLVRNRTGETTAHDDQPTLNQLSAAFIEAARADLQSIRSDA